MESRYSESKNKQDESLLKKIKCLANIGTWEYQVKHDILIWSDEVYDIFGINDKPEKLTLDFFYSCIHPDDLELVKNAYAKSLLNCDPGYEIEHKIIKKNTDEIRCVIEKCEHTFNDAGEIIQSLGIVQDITEKKDAEQKLDITEEKFKTIFTTAPLGIGVVVNRKFIEVNQHFISMIGYTKDEIIDKSARMIYPSEEEYENVGKVKYRQIDKSGVGFVQTTFKTKKGKLIDISMYSRPIDTSDYSKGVIFTAEDITEVRKLQNDLKNSEEKFKSMYNDAPLAYQSLDINGNILDVNNHWLNTLGYTKQEVLGKPFGYFWPDSIKNHFPEKFKDLKKHGCKHNLQLMLQRNNGEIFDASYEAQVGYNHDGSFKQTYCVFKDVTEEKTAIKKLQESEEKFSKVFHRNPIICGLAELETGKYIELNKTFYDKLGFTKEEAIGKRASEIVKMDKDFREKSLSSLNENGFIENFETTLQKKNGDPITVLMSAEIIEINNKKYNYTSALDITERKKQEKELEIYRTNLESIVKERTKLLKNEVLKREKAEEEVTLALIKEKEISQFRAKFVSIVSHEFRTPLTSLYSSLELIERYSDKWEIGKKEEHYNRMKNSIEDLTKMLEEMLTLNRSETDKIIFSPQKTDLDSFCKKIIEDFKPLLNQKEDLKYNFQLEQKEYSIDRKLLTVIINNLISNAIKYSNDNIDIAFDIYTEDRNMILSVSDNGIGINNNELNNIFQPFYRTAQTETIKGTGLGLSIVKNYVEIHKGKIVVESEPTIGSKFIVSIPQKIVESK